MLNVALTGNIAAGKSTVVGFFRRWGATIIDADELAREAEAPGSEVLGAIVRRFSADILASDGSLDRADLRSKVMGDDVALTALNAIVHPAVQRRREELQQVAERRGDLLVVNDIPLLFEVLDPAQFDVIILVDAPDALRRTRLRAMRGLSNEEADRMIAAQMPAARKRPRSQFVIEDAGTLPGPEAHERARGAASRARGAGGGAVAGARAAPRHGRAWTARAESAPRCGAPEGEPARVRRDRGALRRSGSGRGTGCREGCGGAGGEPPSRRHRRHRAGGD